MIEAWTQRPLFRARENRQSTSYSLSFLQSCVQFWIQTWSYKGVKIIRLLSFSNRSHSTSIWAVIIRVTECLWILVMMYQSSMNPILSVSGSESHSLTWPSISSLGGHKLLSGWLCATIFLWERCVLPIVCLVTSWSCLLPAARATLN